MESNAIINTIEFGIVLNNLLPYIFNYLDYESLNIISQVCVYWKKLATKLYVTTVEYKCIHKDYNKDIIIPNWFPGLPGLPIKHILPEPLEKYSHKKFAIKLQETPYLLYKWDRSLDCIKYPKCIKLFVKNKNMLFLEYLLNYNKSPFERSKCRTYGCMPDNQFERTEYHSCFCKTYTYDRIQFYSFWTSVNYQLPEFYFWMFSENNMILLSLLLNNYGFYHSCTLYPKIKTIRYGLVFNAFKGACNGGNINGIYLIMRNVKYKDIKEHLYRMYQVGFKIACMRGHFNIVKLLIELLKKLLLKEDMCIKSTISNWLEKGLCYACGKKKNLLMTEYLLVLEKTYTISKFKYILKRATKYKHLNVIEYINNKI